MSRQVHWHEGLFLQPHHLQQFQRSVGQRLGWERARSWGYPYGVVESRISSDELENLRVRFERLLAVMPSGVVVDVPGGADLPPLEIEEAFAATTRPLTVSLGVPLYYQERANAIDPGSTEWRAKRLYRVDEEEVADENSGENPQPVLVRRINARLMLEGEDRTDMETLPLLRIVRSAADESGVPRRDPEFVPPCLVVSGSSDLLAWVRDLSNQVEASRKELVVQATRGGFNPALVKSEGMLALMKLSVLNRFAGRLPTLVGIASSVSPVSLYLELRDFLGELAALHPDLDPFDAPAFDHDRPGVSLGEVCEKIRRHLKVESSGTYLELPLRLEGRVLVGELAAEHVERPNEYFLGVRSGDDPREVARLVEDADEFKLMAKTLVETRIRGVKLAEERHPPTQLPSPVGLHYFRLMRTESARMWDRILAEREIAVKFPGVDQGRFESVTLYMTVPS